VFLWRISNHLSLSGDGTLRASGRWHTRGWRVVYCAQSPAAALLEILVHFEIDILELPVRYRLLKIEAPDDVQVERVSVEDLPRDWPERTEATRALGDGWLTKGSAALLSVPSAIVPETFNVLLNPAHQDAKRIVIVQAGEHAIDPRLLK
jgi:RES domain-containing protein